MASTAELQETISLLQRQLSIFNTITDAVLATHSQEHVLLYNQSFATLWNLPAYNPKVSLHINKIKSHLLNQLEDQPDTLVDKHLLNNNTEINVITNFSTKDGRTITQTIRRNEAAEGFVWVFRDITDDHKQEIEIHQKAQLLERVVDHIPLILFATDMDGNINFSRGKAHDAFDLEENRVGTNIFDDQRISTLNEIRQTLAGQEFHLLDLYKPVIDRFADIFYTPLYDDNNHQIGMAGLWVDVTEERKAQRAKQLHEKFLINILNHAPIFLFVTDMDGNVSLSRGKLLNVYGLEEGHFEGKNYFEVSRSPQVSEHVRQALSGETVNDLIEFEGSASLSTYTPLHDENEQIVGMIAISFDISDQRLMQGELNQQRQFLEHILQSVPIGLLTTDLDGTITLSKGTELDIFGQALDDRVGENLLEGIKHRFSNDIRAALRGNTRRHTHELGEVFLEITTGPLRDQNQAIIGTIIIGVNVTEALKGQQAINESQVMRKAKDLAEAANMAKTSFIANMSHELRTPLNSIIGFTQLLNRESTLTEHQREYISLVVKSGEYLLSLINDILEVAKIEAGKLELNPINFDLYETLESLEEIYQSKSMNKDLVFKMNISDDLPRYVNGDRKMLHQIIVNLLSNAHKYTEKGEIILSVWLGEALHQDRFTIYLSVKDTGIGIAEDEQHLLFQSFSQTASGRESVAGTGLGLMLVKQFVELMAGDVRVESEPNLGSTFTVHFKMSPAIAKVTSKNHTEARVVGIVEGQPEYRILVVDDKWQNRLMLLRLLNSVGFAVREAVNGIEAVQFYEEWHPHLIFMDMRMPEMDGYEATQRIREIANGDDVIIIALTASAFEHDRQEIMGMGCDDYITKPFDEAVLFEKTKNLLDIEFIYEGRAHLYQLSNAELVSAINALPADIRAELDKATSAYSLERLTSIVKDIEPINSKLAQELLTLAREFDFAAISKMVNQS